MLSVFRYCAPQAAHLAPSPVPLAEKSSLIPHAHIHPRRRAGFPTIKAYAGTSRVTTAPAPINAYSPIVIPQTIVLFAPIEAPRFTRVCLYSFLRRTWLRGLITLVNTIDGPQNTSSSRIQPV